MFKLRVMTFNIHGGLGPAREDAWQDFYKGRTDVAPVIRSIRDSEADIVALQEVAVLQLRDHTIDQPHEIASALGMHYRYGPANTVSLPGNAGSYLFGNMVLSRCPIVTSTFHGLYCPLPTEQVEPRGATSPGAGMTYGECSPGWREPRGMLEVDVETPAGFLRFASTHMSWVGQRQITRQVEDVAETMAAVSLPVVVGGDFNVGLRSPALSALCSRMRESFVAAAEAGHPAPDPARLTFPTGGKAQLDIDHIFVSTQIAVERSEVYRDHPQASDHYPVIADICLP